jgi:galactofuranose transport system permease protein
MNRRLLWPAVVLALLLLLNLFFTPGFLSIEVKDGHFYGSLIDILRFGAPLVLVSLGMTLVIATGGIDLSVGSVVAISGALACLAISEGTGVLAAVALAVAVALVLGAFNGFLVAVVGIQPIVATLILMVAGRGLAQLITDGQIITVTDASFKVIGGGYLLMLPFGILLALVVFAATVFLTRRLALGLLIESVGGNAEASRLAGLRSRGILITVYAFAALCAGIAGVMVASNVSSADGNNAGLWIELDAILAVVIGGTLLTGGAGTVLGTVIGVGLRNVIQNIINQIGTLDSNYQSVVSGAFLLVVVILQRSLARTKPRR